jgi:CRP-like cAMP-binding protein
MDIGTRISDPVEHMVVNEFARLAPITDVERSYLFSQLEKKRRHEAGHELIKQDQRLDGPIILLRGWICLAALLPDGRRQILDFYLPGSLVGFCSRPGARAKATYLSLTPVEIASVPGFCHLDEGKYDRLLQALFSVEEECEQRLCNQVTRNGRQSAVESVASLLLELHSRLENTGQTNGHEFTFPLTQEMMADALGLSVVHVNRTLQQLKRRNMIAVKGVHIEIRDFGELNALAHGLPTRGGSSLSRELE